MDHGNNPSSISSSSSSPSSSSTSSSAEGEDRRQIHQQRYRGAQRQVAFLDNLISSLDIIAFVQFATLYYMDCSVIRLAFRAIHQFHFFTPKPLDRLFPPVVDRTYVWTIVLVNMCCILPHLSSFSPEPLPTARGYLHGGVIVDFIGQKAPASYLLLVLVDLIIIAIQLVLVDLKIKRVDWTKRSSSTSTNSVDTTSDEALRNLEEGRQSEVQESPAEQNLAQMESLYSGTRLLLDVDVYRSAKLALSVPVDTESNSRLTLRDLRSNPLGALAAERRRQMAQQTAALREHPA